MSFSRLPSRRLAAVALAAAAGLAGLTHVPAAAAPSTPALIPTTSAPTPSVPTPSVPTPSGPTALTGALSAPTRAARAAGVEPGNAPMGWRSALTGSTSGTARSGAVTAAKKFVPSGVLGIDVSSYQGRVSWAKHAKARKQFAYVKATEGTSYRNPYFRSQYDGAADAGLIRGAYHFASPSGSSGKKQAAYFVTHGGAWTADGQTLPGVLDIEYNPYGSTCYGVSKKKMVSWVQSFVLEYKRLTSRDVVIYTTTDWWTRCTGNTTAFSSTNPLWLARYGTKSPGKLPGSWTWATFWQFTSSPVDQNQFSATYARLLVLATDPGLTE